MPPSGHLPAHNTLKFIPTVLNHFNIASEQYFKFQEFCFNEISHIKNNPMNKKTIRFVE